MFFVKETLKLLFTVHYYIFIKIAKFFFYVQFRFEIKRKRNRVDIIYIQ